MGVLNHLPHDCLLNRLFKAQNKENIKGPVTRKMFPFDDVIMPYGYEWPEPNHNNIPRHVINVHN